MLDEILDYVKFLRLQVKVTIWLSILLWNEFFHNSVQNLFDMIIFVIIQVIVHYLYYL